MARTHAPRRIGEASPTPAKIPVALTVNGVATQLKVAPWTTLLDALGDVAAAIANAVYHATGKRVRSLPITLDKLLPVRAAG